MAGQSLQKIYVLNQQAQAHILIDVKIENFTTGYF